MGEDNQSTHSIITKVELQVRKKNRYNIYINEEYAFSLHEDMLIKHRLHKGEEIDRPAVERIMQDEERHAAYLRGLLILGRRSHSRLEMKQKLRTAGYEAQVCEYVIERLQDQGYLNDTMFAQQLADQRISFNRKGRNFVRHELQAKGVSKEQIAQTLESLDVEAEYEAALPLALRKWKSTSGTRIDKKRKTMGLLLRRGYTQSLVRRVIEEIQRSTEFDEESTDLQ